MSLPQAAERLGISESTARRWVYQGRLPAERVPSSQGHGYFYRISVDALDQLGSTDRSKSVSSSKNHRPPLIGDDGPPPTVTQEEPPLSTISKGHGPIAVDTLGEWGASLRAALDLVREKDQQVTGLNERIMQISGQVGFLQSENGQLKEQVKLLQAPPPDEPQRRWWRRVWRWGR